MTIDTSVPSQDKSHKKDRRGRQSSSVAAKLEQVKLSNSSELTKSASVSALFTTGPLMSPMMTSSALQPSAEHGGLLSLGHSAHVRQFGHSLPQIGGHLSAFNHLNLKRLNDSSRPPSRSSSEAAEERPKSGRSATSPPSSSSPSSSPPRNSRLMHHVGDMIKSSPDSDSEIDVDDDESDRKRFKKASRTNSDVSSKLSSSQHQHPALMSSSSFFINDILKSSSSPPSDLHSAFLRTHPHLSPPSTPPTVPHPFSVQDLSLRAGSLHHQPHQSPVGAPHPNAYSLFAAAVAAATGGKPPTDPTALAAAAAAQQQAVAASAGFFGPGQNMMTPLGGLRPPFGMPSLHGLGLVEPPGQAPSATTTGDSDPDMDGDADDDGCSSTDGDDDRKPNGK